MLLRVKLFAQQTSFKHSCFDQENFFYRIPKSSQEENEKFFLLNKLNKNIEKFLLLFLPNEIPSHFTSNSLSNFAMARENYFESFSMSSTYFNENEKFSLKR